MKFIPLFIVPFVVWTIINIIKSIIDYRNTLLWKDFKTKDLINFFIKNFWISWWFPSVHSAISSSLVTLMLLKYGIYSDMFAISITFAFLFWYDATNVRFQAWEHAKQINIIRKELQEILWSKPASLKERLWHTIIEVAGWISIGIFLTVVIYYIFLA